MPKPKKKTSVSNNASAAEQYLAQVSNAYEQEKQSGNDHSQRGSYTANVNASLENNSSFQKLSQQVKNISQYQKQYDYSKTNWYADMKKQQAEAQEKLSDRTRAANAEIQKVNRQTSGGTNMRADAQAKSTLPTLETAADKIKSKATQSGSGTILKQAKAENLITSRIGSLTKGAEDNLTKASETLEESIASVTKAQQALEQANTEANVKAYEDAVSKYASAKTAASEAQKKYEEVAETAQKQYEAVKSSASREQHNALQKEYDRLQKQLEQYEETERLANLSKDTSTWYSEDEKKKIQAAQKSAQKNTATVAAIKNQMQQIAAFIQINDYYMDGAGVVADMDDEEFASTYGSYSSLVQSAEEFYNEATRFRTMAQRYRITSPKLSEQYASYANIAQDRADELQSQADAIVRDEDTKTAVTQRLERNNMEQEAQQDKNYDKYAEVGEKQGWTPTMRESVSNFLTKIGFSGGSNTTFGQQYLDLMTEQQKKTLHYYLGKGDEEAAQQYFSYLEPTLEKRYSENAQADTAAYAEENPILGTVFNAVAQAVVAPAAGVIATAENAINKMKNEDAPYITSGAIYMTSDANRSTVEGLTNSMKGLGASEDTAELLASTIVSVANNAAQFALFSGAGASKLDEAISGLAKVTGDGATSAKYAARASEAIANINTELPLKLMATTAATETVRQQLENGYDLPQAMLYGASVGALEAVSEKLSIDTWVETASKGVTSGVLKGVYDSASGQLNYSKLRTALITMTGVANQIGSEALEEVFSSVCGNAADLIINQRNSVLYQTVLHYRAEGYGDEEATRKAIQEVVLADAAQSAIGGALSGAVFGTINIPAQVRNSNAIGQAVLSMGNEEVYALVASGMEYSKDSQTYKVAEKLTDYINKNEGALPSASSLTQLSLAMEQDSRKAASTLTAETTGTSGNTMSATASGLISTGVLTANEARVMDVVLGKVASGAAVTDAEIRVLNASAPAIREKLSEMLGVEIVDGSAGAVRAAIQVYQTRQADTVRQKAAEAKARRTIRAAMPMATSIVNTETQNEVAHASMMAENDARIEVESEAASVEATRDTYAQAMASSDIEGIDNDTDIRDGVQHLPYAAFAQQFKSENPNASSDDIIEAYEAADAEYTKNSVGSVAPAAKGDTISREAFIEAWQQAHGGESLTEAEADAMLKEANKATSDINNKTRAAGNAGQQQYSIDNSASTAETSNNTAEEADVSAKNEDAAADTVELESGTPGKYSEGRPNLIAEWMARDAKRIFGKYGISNIVVDYTMGINDGNGYYTTENGKPKIVLNGQLGDTTRDDVFYAAQKNIAFVLGHEIGHGAQGGAKTGFEAQTENIIETYRSLNKNFSDDDLNTRVRDTVVKYRNFAAMAEQEGRNIGFTQKDVTMEMAREEVAADMLGEMMRDYNMLSRMLPQHKNLFQRVLSRIIEIGANASKSKKKNAGTGSVNIPRTYAVAAENIELMLRDALEVVQGTENTATEGGVRYAVNEEAGLYLTETTIQEGIQAVAKMAPVVSITGTEFQKSEIDLITKVDQFFGSIGNSVYNEQMGDIILDRRGAKSDIAHGIGKLKAAAFAAVPDVLKSGRVINFQEDWKGRGYQTAVIAAPITIADEPYLLGAVVTRHDIGNRFYVHEVLTQKEGQTPFKTGASQKSGTPGGEYPSVFSLLQKVKDVNTSREESERLYSVDDDLAYFFGDEAESGKALPSAFDRFDGETFEAGTSILSKMQSTELARKIRNAYGSGVDTAALATRYRQASQMAGAYAMAMLDMVHTSTPEALTAGHETMQAVYSELQNMALEMADNIIDGSEASGEYSEELLTFLKDVLKEPIYVADADKPDVAAALGYDTWGEARRARFGVLGKTVNDASKGVEISKIYDDIMDQFPGAVKQGIRSQADQLAAVVEAYDRARESRDEAYNALAYSPEAREANREAIAAEIVNDLAERAHQYANEQYEAELALERAKARRLEREADAAKATAEKMISEGADPELIRRTNDQASELREQSQNAAVMGQPDEAVVLAGMAEGGFKPMTADEAVKAWNERQRTPVPLTPQQMIDRVVRDILAKNDKKTAPKVSKAYSNTLVGGGLISEVQRNMEGMRPEDMTYNPKTEKQSLTEAQQRLDKDYMKWYRALPGKEAWTGVDLDTAMLIYGQVQSECEGSGNFNEAVRWAQLIKDRTSQNAQMVQSLAKYTRTAVGTVVDAAQKLDEHYVNEKGDNKALRDLRKQNDNSAKKLDELTTQNEGLDAEYMKLREQLEAIRAELSFAEAENKESYREVRKAKKALLKATDELDRLHKVSDQLTGELSRLMDMLAWKLAEISNVSRDNRNVLVEKRRLEREIDNANKRYENTQERNRVLRDALEALRNRGLSGKDIKALTKIVEDQNQYMDKLLTALADQRTAAKRANDKAGKTQSASARKRAVTETASEEINKQCKAMQDDLDRTLSQDKKAKLISDMAEFASILDATKEGDKDRLISLIQKQAERRNTKFGRNTKRWLELQDWQYLHDFAAAQLANIADDYIPRTAGKKVATWQYIAQLLNFKTSARNIISNAVFYAQEGFAKNVGALVDAGIGKATGTRTVGASTFRKDDASRFSGAADRAKRSALEVKLDVAVGNSFSKYGEGSNRTFKMAQRGIAGAVGRVLSQAEKVNGYSLTVTDEFFKGAVYRSTINSLASLVANGKLSQQEAEDLAQRQMLYNTFQDDTFVGTALNTLHDGLNSLSNFFEKHDVPVLKNMAGIGLGDFVIKYRTVPGALVTRALEYSPAGYLKALYNTCQLVRYCRQSSALETKMRSDGKGSVSEENIAEVRASVIKAQNNLSMGLARATTGSGLVAAFCFLAMKGIIGNADDEEDKDAKAVNTAEGLSGTQLNISALERFLSGGSTEWQAGDELIDIGFLDPTGSTITMGTMIANSMQNEEETWFSRIVLANKDMALQSFSDLSMMDTINDLLYTVMYHDEESDLGLWTEFGITFATSMFTSLEPSLLRQLAQASDQYYRDTYGGSGTIYDAAKGTFGEDTAKALQTAANEIAVNIPGLRQTVDVKLDSFGRERIYSDSTVANVLNALVNPAKYAKYNPSEVSRELRKLYGETGDASIYPDRNTPSSVQFGDERIHLSPDQKRAYQKKVGSMYDEMVGEMMSGDAYLDANKETKVELLNDLKQYVKFKAKQDLWAETHDGKVYTDNNWTKTEAGMALGIEFGVMRQILKDTNETNMPSDLDEDGETISGSREGKIMDYLNELDSKTYTDEAKLALYGIIRGAGAESSTRKLEKIVESGLTFAEATEVRKLYNGLNASRDENADGMKDRDVFERYLREQGYTERQREIITGNYKFYTQIPQDQNSTIAKLVEEGMDYDTAYSIAAGIENLVPESGEDSVSTAQKYDQIVGDSTLSTYEKQKTIAALGGTNSAFGDLDEDVAAALMDVYESTGTTAVLSIQPADSITVDYKEYAYTEEQYTASREAYLSIMNQMGGGYLTDAKLVSNAKDIASNAAKYAAMTEGGFEPDLDSSDYSAYRRALQAQNVGLDLSYYVAVKAQGNSFTADKNTDGESISGSKKTKVVNYLRSLGLSEDQYEFFYHEVFGYS